MKSLEKLIGIGGASLGTSVEDSGISWLPSELVSLLKIKNGFYVFESALLIRSIGFPGPPASLELWNDPSTWICCFENIGAMVFFAEDVFGGQFAWADGRIVGFDPETCEVNNLCASIDEWAGLILEDYDYHTGYSIAHAWQRKYGPLLPGTRLIPQKPFVLGGEFEIANLKATNEVKGMRIRAGLANQLRHMPDGTQVAIEFTE